jgi:hypothetical protein
VPKTNFSNIAQKAINDATGATRLDSNLSIKGAGSQGNVVEVSGLVTGTTPEDVAAIFKRCGQITNQKAMSTRAEDVRIRITFKTPAAAAAAVQKFHDQPADGKILSVKIVGTSSEGISLGGRLGGTEKLYSDSLIHTDPRAQVLLAPPGMNPAEYLPESRGGGGGRRGGFGRGRGGRRGRRGGDSGNGQMDVD